MQGANKTAWLDTADLCHCITVISPSHCPWPEWGCDLDPWQQLSHLSDSCEDRTYGGHFLSNPKPHVWVTITNGRIKSPCWLQEHRDANNSTLHQEHIQLSSETLEMSLTFTAHWLCHPGFFYYCTKPAGTQAWNDRARKGQSPWNVHYSRSLSCKQYF